VNVYRLGLCSPSRRLSHGHRHGRLRWTWRLSAAIAMLSRALHRFRQMDTMLSSLKLLGTRDFGFWWRVFLSEPDQSYCAAGVPSRQHPCLSVSMVSDLLPSEQAVNRWDQPPALQEFPSFGGRWPEMWADHPGTALERTYTFSFVVALIPRWRYMTDGSKAIVKRAAISVLVIFLSLTILRAFLNYIILAVIIYAALQLFNRK